MDGKELCPEKLLYIFDEHADIGKLLSQCRGEGGQIFLIPLTINGEYITSILRKVGSSGKVDNILVPFTRLFNEKAFSIRDDYIKFIYDFGEVRVSGNENLKKYFKALFGNFSNWWLSLIAEKNTLGTDSFHNLAKLLTILDLRKQYNCTKVLVDINNPKLSSALVDNLGNQVCIPLQRNENRIISISVLLLGISKGIVSKCKQILWTKLIMKGLNSRKKILMNSKYLIVTYFPVVNKSALEKNKFVNRYFEPLQAALEKKYKEEFVWLAITFSNEDFSYKDSIPLGRKMNKWGNSLFFYEEWLNLFDLFLAGLEYLYTSVKFILRHSLISRQFKFQNVKIWDIFKKDWYLSFCGVTLVESLLYYRAFRKVFRQLMKGATIIYLAENYAWEKTLNIASHAREGLKSVGVQHTIVPLLLLNYFNSREELEEGSYIQKVPKPDYLGCVGRIPLELFKESGWDEEKLFILGPMRFQYLKDYRRNEISWEQKRNEVVVALSLMPEESKEILLYVYEAFRNSSCCRVLIKGHPFLSLHQLINSLNIRFDEKIFQIVTAPLSKLLPKAKCLIVTESSATLEGVIFGCVVVIPRLVNVVDMNPLSGISDLPVFVNNPGELKEAVEKVIMARRFPLSSSLCENLTRDYFEFPDSDEDFLKQIREINEK